MQLNQIVLDEIQRLRRLQIDEVKALPPLTETSMEIEGKVIELHVYREDSHDGRVIVIAKVFRRRLFFVSAAAEGFAITKENVVVQLDDKERSSLL